MTAKTKQVGGDHYKLTEIQPIEYILANKLEFCEGNIVKYATRWRFKGGIEDLEKIKHYCDFLIEQHNAENAEDNPKYTINPNPVRPSQFA